MSYLRELAPKISKQVRAQQKTIANMYPLCEYCMPKVVDFWSRVEEAHDKSIRDHQHNPDPNVNAARIVAEATKDKKACLPT